MGEPACVSVDSAYILAAYTSMYTSVLCLCVSSLCACQKVTVKLKVALPAGAARRVHILHRDTLDRNQETRRVQPKYRLCQNSAPDKFALEENDPRPTQTE